MTTLRGGRTLYGLDLGILMLDTAFPRPVGDIGNAATWPFPVRYHVVGQATPERVVERPDEALLGAFIDGARELEREGVRAITTSCGFLALYQRELATAVRVPVATSSLLQVPFIARTLPPTGAIGILTMSREDLTERHFAGVGWSSEAIRIAVAGFDEDAMFRKVYLRGAQQADQAVLERELVRLALELRGERPDIGAFVLECTNMVPYAHAVRGATRLPVYDIYTLVMQLHAATRGHDFTG
jgi:hypothetical protein